MAAASNAGGLDLQAVGTHAIAPAGTAVAAGVDGTVYTGAGMNAAFGQIVTTLVVRNLIEMLREKTVFLQEGAWMRASHVQGTKDFTYTAFGDLPPAQDLLEGVPPQTVGLTWDTFTFGGGQKGNIVAITDLAEIFNPFDLYRVAAEKVAWNALDTAEKQAAALFGGATVGVPLTPTAGDQAKTIIDGTVGMKNALVPTFPDGTYHCVLSPTDAAKVMKQTGEMGWTDTMKYAKDVALLNGEIGTFRGVRFVESTRAVTGKAPLFGPDAVVWGDYQTIQTYRVAPGGDHGDPLAQRGLVGWKGMWGMALVAFDGSPVIGPAANVPLFRFGQLNLA
jgi:N4-gp56 family major capsid protein